MNQTKGSYRHYLKIYFKQMDAPLFLNLREKAIHRFEVMIEDINSGRNHDAFYWVDTVDGRSYAINPGMIQAAHVLWEPAQPEDDKYYEGPIRIQLKDRSKVIETHTEEPDCLMAIYDSLHAGKPSMTPFFDYMDEDGERLYINTSELIYIEAPAEVLSRGHKIIMEDIDSTIPPTDEESFL